MPARPDEDGDHLLRVVEASWRTTQQSWRDDMARHFERTHWTPLLAESRAYLGALRDCLDMMSKADRDTEF